MENLSVALEANINQFQQNLATAAKAVQDFTNKAGDIPVTTPKFQGFKTPKITVDTAEVERALDTLGNRLRIAQANAELFGDQFQADRLKLVSYQQALNQLISAGLTPTSKEVLKVADNIEKLANELQEAERQTKRLDMFASFKATGKIIPDLEAKAKRLQTALRNATDVKDIERYQKRLAAVNNDLAQFGTRGIAGVRGVNKGMGDLAGSAGQVNMEFARIIQDVPYGMMGIGNNIQQLTSNFGQLQRSAGGTGAAIKATLASMITPASLLTLGIAALTSGWVLYQEWSRKSADTTAEIASEMEKAAKATDDYLGSLTGINKARAEGLRDAQKEVVTLKLLYERTQDTTLSMQERVKAVDELQEQYPEYFKNLKDEEILTGKAAEQYKLLTAELIKAASARAALSLIEKKAEERAVNKLRINDLKEQQKEQEKSVKQAQKLQTAMDAAAASSSSMLGGTGSVSGANKVFKLKEAYDETGKSIDSLIERNRKLDKEMLLLAPEAAPALFKDEEVKATKEKTDKIAEAWKKLVDGFNNSTRLFKELGNEYDVFGAKADLLNGAFEELTSLGLNPQSKAMQTLIEQWREFREAAKMPELKSIESEVKFKPVVDAKDFRKIDFDIYSGLVDDNRIARESLQALGATFGTLDYQIGMASAELRNYETALSESIAQGLSASSPRVVEFSEKIAMLRDELIKLDMQRGVFPTMGAAIDIFMNKAASSTEKLAAMGAVISDFAITAFSSVGKGLGDMFQGLASGVDVIKNIGADILDALSEYLADFGKKLFLAGLGETLLGFPTGPAKMAVGGLLIAAAGFGSSLSGGLRSGGGNASPNVATSISGTGGYRPSDGAIGGDGEVTFRIEGEALVGVLERRNYRNKRFGSG